jgi:HIV-1 Vpr-binding protein
MDVERACEVLAEQHGKPSLLEVLPSGATEAFRVLSCALERESEVKGQRQSFFESKVSSVKEGVLETLAPAVLLAHHVILAENKSDSDVVFLQAAAMRFLLACQTSPEVSFSVTDTFESQAFLQRLKDLVLEDHLAEETNTNMLHHSVSCSSQKLQKYSTGLLAVALGNDEVVDEFVRTGVVAAKLVRSLREAIIDTDTDTEGIDTDTRPCHQWPTPSYNTHRQQGRSSVDHQYLYYCVQCLACMGEYVECCGAVLKDKGVEVSVRLLQQWKGRPEALASLLHLICSLLAHRKYAQTFVDKEGVELLLDLPRGHSTGVSMCLFGISSIPEALEQVCNLPEDVRHRVTRLVLDHISSGIDPARKNASLFLAEALKYLSMLECFDKYEGLGTILNLLRATQHFESTRSEAVIAYHLLCVLRSYFKAQLTVVVASYSVHASSSTSGSGSGSRSSLNPAKAIDMSSEALSGAISQAKSDRSINVWFAHEVWDPVKKFIDLGGVETLLHFVQPHAIGNYHSETVISVFEIMQIVTLPHGFHGNVENSVVGRAGLHSPIEILLTTAMKYKSYSDPAEAVGALQVIANLVCVPEGVIDLVIEPQNGGNSTLAKPHGTNHMHVALASSFAKTFERSRRLVRANNGIKVLLALLCNRCHDIRNSEMMSYLSLQALLGLAQDPSIAQVLSKLQLPHLLSEMLRDPKVNPGYEKTRYSTNGSYSLFAQNFRRAALKLIAVLTGADLEETISTNDATISALQKLEKASIVASTKITYPQRELLQLIHEHLLASGMVESAQRLEAEAKLVQGQQQESIGGGKTPQCGENILTFPSHRSALKNIRPRPEAKRLSFKFNMDTEKNHSSLKRGEREQQQGQMSSLPKRQKQQHSASQKGSSSSSNNNDLGNKEGGGRVKSNLDSIILKHLRHQHSECEAPISVLPPFSLVEPYKNVCPKGKLEGIFLESTSPNIASRMLKMQSRAHPSDHKYLDRKLNKHFIHSRFRHMRTFKDLNDTSLTACSFMGNSQQLVVSTDSGEIRVLDTFSGEIVDYFDSHAHSSAIHSLRTWQPRGGAGWPCKLLSSASNDVVLWDTETLRCQTTFQNVHNGCFDSFGTKIVSPVSNNRTKMAKLHIFDISSGSSLPVQTLKGATPNDHFHFHTGHGCHNHPNYNQAAHFGLEDKLVLWGHILWDMRMSTPIHFFDRFTDFGGGSQFHPNGLEIILNSEVWDLRTYKLLKSVPSLDGANFLFNHTGEVIYSWHAGAVGGEERFSTLSALRRHPVQIRAFKVLDAHDYRDISTINMEKNLLDMSIAPEDSLLATLSIDQCTSSCAARLYEIGRKKPQDCDSDLEDADDEEEEDEEEESEIDDDDDDDEEEIEEEEEEDESESEIDEELIEEGLEEEEVDVGDLADLETEPEAPRANTE